MHGDAEVQGDGGPTNDGDIAFAYIADGCTYANGICGEESKLGDEDSKLGAEVRYGEDEICGEDVR